MALTAAIGGTAAISASENGQVTKVQEVNKLGPVRIQELVPKNEEKLNTYMTKCQMVIELSAKQIQSMLERERPMSEIILLWDKAHSKAQVAGTVLWKTGETYPELEGLADKWKGELVDAYNSTFRDNEGLKQAFAAYAQSQLDADLTPYEWDYLYRIARGFELDVAESLEDKPREDFQTLKGDLKPKTLHIENGEVEFSTFTNNMIFMPENYTYYFGGISPWENRVEALAAVYKELDVDVLTLQEGFSEEGTEALFDRLKGDYAYGYNNIGQNYFGDTDPKGQGIDAERLAINSGNVALTRLSSEAKPTNYTFEATDPAFADFENFQWVVKKGFFVVPIEADGQNVGRVITTHLQPFNTPEGRDIRKAELAKITDYIENNPIEGLTIVQGDLNIVYGERTFGDVTVNEYEESGIPENYIDLSHKDGAHITCSDEREDFVYSRENEPGYNPENSRYTYDYVLIPKDDEHKLDSYKIEPIKLRDTGLTDHDGFKTTFKVKVPPKGDS